MEYKLECPGFFLRTETCTGPVNRFDAAALAPERQTLALEGLPMAASVRLLGLLGIFLAHSMRSVLSAETRECEM